MLQIDELQVVRLLHTDQRMLAIIYKSPNNILAPFGGKTKLLGGDQGARAEGREPIGGRPLNAKRSRQPYVWQLESCKDATATGTCHDGVGLSTLVYI